MRYRNAQSLEKDFAKMDRLKTAVCTYYRIKETRLFNTSRYRDLVHARHQFHYLAHITLRIKSGVVGLYSGRDHATILHSKKKIEGYLDVEKSIQTEIKDIMELYTVPSKIKMIWLILKESYRDIYNVIKWRTA